MRKFAFEAAWSFLICDPDSHSRPKKLVWYRFASCVCDQAWRSTTAKDATDVLTLMTSFCILKTSTLMLDTRARCHFLKLIRVIFGKRSKSNAFHFLRHWIIGEFRGEGQNWCVQLVASLLATFTRMVHQLTQQLANLDLVQLKWFLASKGIA